MMNFQRIRDRRRRVLRSDLDETTVDTAPEAESALSTASTKRSNRAYGMGARKKQQLRTTDLIPKRPLAFSLAALILLTSAVTVTLVQSWANIRLTELENASQTAASVEKNLNAERLSQIAILQHAAQVSRELNAWLCSVLFIVASTLSLQIFSLRKHRRDDYNGWYRLWAWFAGVLFLASAGCIVDFRPLVIGIVHQATDLTILRSGALFWLGLVVSLIALITARVVYEVRTSPLSASLFILAGTVMSTSFVLEHDWFRQQFIGQVTPLLSSVFLWSAMTVTLAMAYFARFVYLEAHSLLKRRPVAEMAKTNSTTRRRLGFTISKKQKSAKSSEPMEKSQPSRARNNKTSIANTTGTEKTAKTSNESNEQSRARATGSNSSQKHQATNLIKMSNADRALLQKGDSSADGLSKSEKRRLKKLHKQTRDAA
ncbi:MAG TPA: hypothetical protein PKD64_00720 [Pirellulaceae bacterium]|nr:hypothetical protein [Pirellulaceae bacterium]HMO90693.1 hypothetical protein [Pirellulaceae bacterium]HMP67728.1 hypothetical protein [Pirellulaceae bacterium]